MAFTPLYSDMAQADTGSEYDIRNVEGSDTLLDRMKSAETVEDWSFILSDYVSFGNSKISDSVAIFNMNAAEDCPNRESEECQVPWEKCYAHQAEVSYPAVLPYRRRQEYLWDCLDADTFADAFRALVSRKRNDVSAIRFSEAGDFRHRGDIVKVNRIAALLSPDFDVYTYSASSYLDWSDAEHFTVNQSNDFADYGDRLYAAVEEPSDIPEDGLWCPHDREKSKKGVTSDEAIQCGECRLCIDEGAPDVYITLH